MVLKFYGHPSSPPSNRAELILHELQIPFENITIDLLAREQKQEWYTAKHPFGQVPCIDDDGFVVYESRAIGRYLCEKYAPQLYPRSGHAGSLFEQAASVEVANFDAPAARATVEKYFNRLLFKKPTNEAVLAENVEKLNNTLAVYESILSKQKYLVGDQLTLVDLYHVPLMQLAEMNGFFSLEDKPNVARWWKELATRPSSQAAQALISGWEASLNL